MDKVSPSIRSFIMSRIRSQNTTMEILFARELRRRKISFRQHGALLGKPDFIFPRARVVVFLDSCFWHRCPYHYRQPKSRSEYWLPKIARNVERDKVTRSEYRRCGWKVIRYWEHQIQADILSCVESVINLVRTRLELGVSNATIPAKPARTRKQH